MICCSVTVCVGVCVCVVPGLYEGGRRCLVVECQDDPLTKGTIRDKLLLLWYLAYTVGRSCQSVIAHTLKKHTHMLTYAVVNGKSCFEHWKHGEHVYCDKPSKVPEVPSKRYMHKPTFSHYEFLLSKPHGRWLQ